MAWQNRKRWGARNANGTDSKYGNRTCKGLDGRSYHSALEASVSNWLLAQERAGEIIILKRQQHLHLFSEEIKVCEYWPDFTIQDVPTKEIYWVEAKGTENPDWLIKLNLWRAGGPGRLDIIKGDWKRPKLKEHIFPLKPMLHCRQDQVFGKLL
jgi:hypothetical protein